jgi:hypothetical protein
MYRYKRNRLQFTSITVGTEFIFHESKYMNIWYTENNDVQIQHLKEGNLI